jgi:addiction module RelE/StbE family toxin
MKIIFTPQSVDDLKHLREFIEQKNPEAANRIAKHLLAGIARLKVFPNLGIEVKKAQTDMIRDLISGDYIIRYLLLKETIHILKIWHHKEDWNTKEAGRKQASQPKE